MGNVNGLDSLILLQHQSFLDNYPLLSYANRIRVQVESINANGQRKGHDKHGRVGTSACSCSNKVLNTAFRLRQKAISADGPWCDWRIDLKCCCCCCMAVGSSCKWSAGVIATVASRGATDRS